MQHSAYKGDVWTGPDDFVRNCFGIEGTGQDGFKAWATATSQEWHQSGFLLGLDRQVHLDFCRRSHSIQELMRLHRQLERSGVRFHNRSHEAIPTPRNFDLRRLLRNWHVFGDGVSYRQEV